MTAMKVLAVKQVAEGSSDRGPWTRQKVRLQDGDGFVDAQLFCHSAIPVPKEGDVLDVQEIKQPSNPDWLPDVKLVYKGRGGGGGGGPRPEDPKRMASIAMQHSQDTALRMVTFALENGLLKEAPTLERLAELVATEAKALYWQVYEAQKAS